jgi:hypothetical protein
MYRLCDVHFSQLDFFVGFSSMSLCQVQKSLGGLVHFGNMEVWNGYVVLRLLLVRLA